MQYRLRRFARRMGGFAACALVVLPLDRNSAAALFLLGAAYAVL